MKKTSTDSAAPATFDEYMDLNTHQDDLAQIGVNPVEWNTDNFLDDRKYMNRAREILRTNPNISPVDAEMKIIAIRAAIRKCAITDVEKRETYNIELHAYKLLKDWLMNNYRGNKKMKNISENKNMKKNTVKLNENALRKLIAESVKNILSEIDWKTYRNAQEKNREREPEYEKNYWKLQDAIDAAIERGDDKEVQRLKRKQEALVGKSTRTTDFGFASNDAFDDKFFANSHDRFNKQHGKSFAPFKRTDDGSYSTPEPWMDDNGNIHHGSFFAGHGKVDGKYFDDTIEYSKPGRTFDGETNGDDKTAYSDEELRSLGFPDNEFNDIEKARREIRRYRNGDYTYDNEKGWHLKESVEKAVNTVLKEYLNKKK